LNEFIHAVGFVVFYPLFLVRSNLPSFLADRDAIFPALFAAVAALIVVSAFTPKPSAEQLAKLAE
jgi:hypothetical protein